MDIDDQFELEHLFLTERKCRVCGNTKDLIDGFYLTRKGRGDIPSAYSYECKICTIQRITTSRMTGKIFYKWEYPDW
jgi:DNA-directed RNA polymerase subunit M/transcription elongation factor TFIIS